MERYLVSQCESTAFFSFLQVIHPCCISIYFRHSCILLIISIGSDEHKLDCISGVFAYSDKKQYLCSVKNERNYAYEMG